MRKCLKYFILVIAIIFVSGCDSNVREVQRTCKLTTNAVAQGYKLESEYVIYGKGDVVNKVSTIETVISDDEEILDYFEETLRTTYDATSETYGGYTIDITNENGKVVSKVTIDYNKMNLEQYVEDNSVMKDYVNSDNKLMVSGLVNLYESLGATCE